MANCKVVFVTPHWGKPRTGPEVYARYLWEAFKDDTEIEFHVVAGGSGGGHPRLHLVNHSGDSLRLFRDIATRALGLMDVLGGRGVLHVNNSNLHTSLLRSQWPIIGQINDYETANFYKHFFRIIFNQGPRRLLSLWRRRILEARFVRQQTVTLCNSEYTRQEVIRAYGISDLERIRVLHKAVDTSDFNPPSGVQHPVGRPPVVFFAGSDFQRKGLDVLIDALTLSAQPLSLRIAGVTELDFESAFPQSIAKARNRGASVAFLGQVERSRMPKLLWESDIFCLPSRAEALGVALLEALAAGLPCVATNVGGIPEIARVVPGVILVNPNDPEGLAQALQQGLEYGCRNVASAALRESFGRESMLRRLRALYLEMKP